MPRDIIKLGPADGSVSEPPASPVQFEEAIEAFRDRVPMTDDEFEALGQIARKRAFTVANLTQLEVINDVWRALDSAIANGDTFEDFKKAVGLKLQSDWGGEKPGRLETIFRTNVQTAYGAGRVRQLKTPAVLKRRPFWKFSAVLDGRTSPICSGIAGTVLAADDSWWSSRQPPLHHQCRSTILPLTEAQAEAAGIAEQAPDIAAAKGFGNVEAPEDWEPDLTTYPEPLRAAYLKKTGT